MYKIWFVFKIELLFDIGRFLNVIVNLHLQIFSQVVPVWQNLECLNVPVLFNILWFYVRYQIPHTIDVVSQTQTTECLNHHNTDGLFVVGRSNVTKSYCQHDGCAPVKGPNILFLPGCVFNTFLHHPTLVLIKLTHQNDQNGQNVREGEVKQKHLR
jgi:hypothetical protein